MATAIGRLGAATRGDVDIEGNLGLALDIGVDPDLLAAVADAFARFAPLA